MYVCIYRARFRAGYAKGAHDPAGYVARHVLIAGSFNLHFYAVCLAVVAEAIRRNPETWSDVILGYVRIYSTRSTMTFHPGEVSSTHDLLVVLLFSRRRPRDEYIRTILSPNSWGGAIELTILAAHYGTEIASIDVESGRIDRFTGSGSSDDGDADAGAAAGASESRVLLIYSGIHYDAAVLAPTPDAPQEFCASVVPASATTEGERVLEALQALATKLRAKRAYTNTATFDLKCEVRGFRSLLLALSC